MLSDGSCRRVYKRFFTRDGLAEELGGGEILFEGRSFLVVRTACGELPTMRECMGAV